MRLRLALKELDWVLIYTNFQTQVYGRSDLFDLHRTAILGHYGLEDGGSRQARNDLHERLLTSALGIPGWPMGAVSTRDPAYMRYMDLLLMHLFTSEARHWYRAGSPRLATSDRRLVDFRQVFARHDQIRRQLSQERRR